MGWIARDLLERRFLLRVIALPGLAALNVTDILSASLAPPGIFGFWVVRGTVVGGFLLGVILAVGDTRRKKALRQERLRQREFEARRLREFQLKVQEEAEFQTHCYRCRHYNTAAGDCGLDILNPEARRVRLGTPFRYCLYWEPHHDDAAPS